jgi:hypothetical protein
VRFFLREALLAGGLTNPHLPGSLDGPRQVYVSNVARWTVTFSIQLQGSASEGSPISSPRIRRPTLDLVTLTFSANMNIREAEAMIGQCRFGGDAIDTRWQRRQPSWQNCSRG